MKTRIIFSVMVLMLSSALFSQVPQGFNYQAIARDGSGNEITKTDMTVLVSIFTGESADILVWQEEHRITTNAYGLINLVVGDPDAIPGKEGLAKSFSEIDWLLQPLYINIMADWQGTMEDMGTSQLMTVPYSMVAGQSLSLAGNPLMMNGDTIYFLNNVSVGSNTPGKAKLAVVGDDPLSQDALFEVRRDDGEIMFAVYNTGVRINVPVNPLAKGPKGGFAIGGFDAAKGVVQDYFTVNNDSIRLYIDTNPAVKSPKGGFAIGGFDAAKATGEEYLRVTRDSTRVYVRNSAKGPKGGFAIGGFDAAKGTADNFLDLTPENYFIGHQAGFSNISGLYNAFIGFRSGYSNVDADYNTYVGYETGLNSNSDYNTFVGYQAGRSISQITAGGNVFMGYLAGTRSTSGYRNVFIGYNSGAYNINGYENTFLGGHAGYGFNTGNANVMIGTYAGNYFYGGNNNIFIGNKSGYGIKNGTDLANNNIFVGTSAGTKVTTGYDNTFIGTESGYNNSYGHYNVLIGNRSGYSNTGYNNIFIGYKAGESSSSTTNTTFIGNEAGRNLIGDDNLAIGDRTGTNDYVAENECFGQVILGIDAGRNITGDYNTILGYGAGSKWGASASGSNNTFLGFQAGGGGSYKLGTGNVCVGYEAGYNVNGDNKLYIANNSTTALLYGEFDNQYLKLTGDMEITHNLIVEGTISNPSDARYKKNIREMGDVIPSLMKLRSVYYNWDSDEFPEMNFSDGTQIGFIAQEVEPLFPELVVTDRNGYKSVDYSRMSVILFQAVREQQQVIEDDKAEIDRLKDELGALEQRLMLIEETLGNANR